MQYQVTQQQDMTRIGLVVSKEFDQLLKDVSEKNGTWNKSLILWPDLLDHYNIIYQE